MIIRTSVGWGCASIILALTACSSTGTVPLPDRTSVQAPASSDAPTPTATAGTAPASSPPSAGIPTPPALVTDALSDVECAPDSAGVWSFRGTLTNTGTSDVTYLVAIAVGVNTSVAGHAMIEQTVKAGENVRVTAEALAVGAPAGARCDAVVSK